MNNNFEYKIHKVIKDREGRYVICDIELEVVAHFLMINIYGPNQDKPSFFNNIFKILEKREIRNWIITQEIGIWH